MAKAGYFKFQMRLTPIAFLPVIGLLVASNISLIANKSLPTNGLAIILRPRRSIALIET